MAVTMYKTSRYLYSLVLFVFALKLGNTIEIPSEVQTAVDNNQVKVHDLVFQRRHHDRTIEEREKSSKKLDIYCYKGESHWKLTKAWGTSQFLLKTVGEEYALYYGKNISDVYRTYKEAQKKWWDWLPWKTDTIRLSPINHTCIAIKTFQAYSLQLKVKVLDPWLILCLTTGVLLFVSAAKLSRNIMFYYGTGISIGVLASLLIVILILSRFIPKKSGYVVLVGGWSVTLWALRAMYENLETIIVEYSTYVLAYFGIVGLISFGICYYKGPVSDPRSLNLIKWMIQIVATVMIYNGCQFPQISVAIIVIILSLQYFPYSIARRFKSFWRFRFPKARKMLSEEDYLRQGSEETRKALEDLREYCRSPKCDAWRTISRLESPSRFAKYIEGDSHVTEDEMSIHELDPCSIYPSFTEDEAETSFEFHMNTPVS